MICQFTGLQSQARQGKCLRSTNFHQETWRWSLWSRTFASTECRERLESKQDFISKTKERMQENWKKGIAGRKGLGYRRSPEPCNSVREKTRKDDATRESKKLRKMRKWIILTYLVALRRKYVKAGFRRSCNNHVHQVRNEYMAQRITKIKYLIIDGKSNLTTWKKNLWMVLLKVCFMLWML